MASTASFPLASLNVVQPSTGASRAARAGAVSMGDSRALIRPLRRDGINDFASASGQRRVEAALGQVLGTRSDSASGSGELPWRTEFGNRLHLLRHRNNDAVAGELARQYVLEAVGRWLPAVRVLDVRLQQQDTVLTLEVLYAVVASGTGQERYRGGVRVPLTA